MKTKVILDTDIGSDIDDAVALAYLLAQPRCELMGITTVTGEATKRAMMASALCKIARRDVPIFPGVEKPFLVAQRQLQAPQAEALRKWPHETKFPQGQAIEFLKKTIRANPGEIVLLTIGPLTNIGLLFAEDPEIPSLLKRLVMMCGMFAGKTPNLPPGCEWNGILDPHATAIVYNAPVKIHRSIGLDVTKRVTMNADEVRKRFHAPPLLRPVLDFAEVWFRDAKVITFHDPLAAATIFEDDVCAFSKGTVAVELANPKTAGMTIWTPGGDNPRHEVALDVKPERFFEHYFSVF